MEAGVISENFARKTCKLGFTEKAQKLRYYYRLRNSKKMFDIFGFSFDFTCFANINHFEANVFSLSVTISPDDQGLALPHLFL